MESLAEVRNLNDAFKSHMMYDPKTGKAYKANTMRDHLKMKDMGYTHDAPKKEALDKEDEPIVKKVAKLLKKASQSHAGQADDLVKAMTEEVQLDEAKYDLYHKDFSSAMQHAYKMAKKLHGITVDPKEIDDKVASGPRKPSEGKTNSYRLEGDKGSIQVQVYNKGGPKPFELNFYKEEVELDESVIDKVKEIASKKSAAKIDGVMVDSFTASAISQIYDKVNDASKKKMDGLPITKLATLAMKMMQKNEYVPEDVDLDEASKLPPHLAKFFDKDGNLKKDAAARIAKGQQKLNIKDVTPKGYGPSEEADLDEGTKQVLAHGGKGKYKVTKDGDTIEIKFGGKVVGTADFDRGADSFFVSMKGQKGQKSFDDAQAIADYFAKNKITEEVELDEEEDFKPHKMYDPKTGEAHDAKTMEDHLRMKKMGYVHEKPKVEESAASDARRAMAADPSTKQKFSKNVSATDDDIKAADKNIMMQMRKAVSLRGNKVEFMDKKKVDIPQKIAQAVLDKYNSQKKPSDKEKFQAKVSKSYKSMLTALKERNEINNKNNSLHEVRSLVRGMKGKNNG